MMTFEKFAKEHWQPGILLALKPSSVRVYQFNLDKYVLPTLGSLRLCDVDRATIRHLLLALKHKGVCKLDVTQHSGHDCKGASHRRRVRVS